MRNQFLLFVMILFSASSFFSCYTYKDMVSDLYVAEAKKKKPQFTYISHDKLERSWMISEIPSKKMQPQNIEIGLGKGPRTIGWSDNISNAREKVDNTLKDIVPVCCPDPPICGDSKAPWSPPSMDGHRVIFANDMFETTKIKSGSIQHKVTQQVYFGTIDTYSITFEKFHTGNSAYTDGDYIINIVLEDKKSGEMAVLKFEQEFRNP